MIKATGIVRKIDDLGRFCLPKELRRTLQWSEGDPLEIYVEDGGKVILKKYDPSLSEMQVINLNKVTTSVKFIQQDRVQAIVSDEQRKKILFRKAFQKGQARRRDNARKPELCQM